MGPRLFSRGKVGGQLRVLPTCAELQWGRGCSAAERSNRWAGKQPGHSASMGPRLFSRGKTQVPIDSRQKVLASMGPRLFSRGKGDGWRLGGRG